MADRGAARAWAGMLALGAALGCGDPEARAALAAAILNGESSPSPEHDAVVLVQAVMDAAPSLCTGTLVAPNLVVTARHCVAHVLPGPFHCTLRGELTGNPDRGGEMGLDVPPHRVFIHVGEVPSSSPSAVATRIVSSLSPSVCLNDLAFLVLDRELDAPIRPVRLQSITAAGERVTLVGYGLSEGEGQLDLSSARRSRLTDQEVLQVGPDSTEEGVIDAPVRKLVLRGASVCYGDSGGPAIAEATGAVIGVYSLGSGTRCADRDTEHLYTHLPPLAHLAEAAFEAAGAQPWQEGAEPLGLGEPCGTGRPCASGWCEQRASERSCAQRCARPEDCPSGWVCSGEAGRCERAPAPCVDCAHDTELSEVRDSERGCATARQRSGCGCWWLACAAVALSACRRADRSAASGWRRRAAPATGGRRARGGST